MPYVIVFIATLALVAFGIYVFNDKVCVAAPELYDTYNFTEKENEETPLSPFCKFTAKLGFN